MNPYCVYSSKLNTQIKQDTDEVDDVSYFRAKLCVHSSKDEVDDIGYFKAKLTRALNFTKTVKVPKIYAIPNDVRADYFQLGITLKHG